MNAKRWTTALLLLFLVAALGTLAVKEYRRRAAVPAAAAAPPSEAPADRQVVVYYLHTTTRCPSCMKIESYTAAAVTGARFSEALAKKRLVFKVLNTDEPEHAHFVKEYALVTKSVVVSEVVKGKEVRWKNLDKVWDLLGDEAAFRAYIETEVAAFLGAGA